VQALLHDPDNGNKEKSLFFRTRVTETTKWQMTSPSKPVRHCGIRYESTMDANFLWSKARRARIHWADGQMAAGNYRYDILIGSNVLKAMLTLEDSQAQTGEPMRIP
jgi:hypothetical protein